MLARALAIAAFVGATTGAIEVREISHSGAGAYEASLAPLGDGFVAAWYDTRSGTPSIYTRTVAANGEPTGPERRLTRERTAYEPDVASIGSDIIVAWYESDPKAVFRAELGRWQSSGRQRWRRHLSLEGNHAKNPVVRVHGQRIFVAWLEAEPQGTFVVRAEWFTADGQPLTPSTLIAPAGATTWNLNAAIDGDGRAWVAFDARVQSRADELFLSVVDGETHRTVQLTADDGVASKYPDLALSESGTAALTWFDERDGNEEVYLAVGSLPELASGLEQRAVRVTNTPGASIGAYLTWNRDRIGLAWCDNTTGQHEIYFEQFDQRGRAVEAPVRVTTNSSDSLIPAIRASADGFVLAWNELTPGPAGGHDPRSRSEIAFARIAASRNEPSPPR